MLTGQVRRLLRPPRSSFFLLGARGTGKSTWVRATFPKARRFDLLDEALYQELLVNPGAFADALRTEARGAWVCVDEVQRLPNLLNEVHRAIEERGLRFVLLGSSARKLRRAGVNLLAGRALVRSMYPFLPQELGAAFELDRALQHGLLPVVVSSPRPLETLAAYAQAYLREEIQAEALVRNVPGFARFLPVAALFHGQVMNVAGVARDAGVARTTVVEFLGILEDTLLAFRLPAFEARLRVRERSHPKLYWLDPGLVRAVKRQSGSVAPEEAGALLEGLVAVMLKAWGEYFGLFDSLAYWAAGGSALEIDFVLKQGKRLLALEVKSSARLRTEDLAALKAFAEVPGVARRVLVYRGRQRLRTKDGIDVLPFEELVRELAEHRLWKAAAG